MKLIKQRHHGDCAIAAIAMFVGVSYEDVEKKLSKVELYAGLTEEREVEVIGSFGIRVELRMNETWDPSEPAVLSVPSLNLDSTLHAVYWDGSRIYDPSTKNFYIELPDRIEYAIQRV